MLRRWLSYFSQMGPAWIVGAVACGPATLASLCIAGASFGFDFLWVVILSAIFGATAQYLAARIGIIEGKGIISVTEERLGYLWGWLLAVDALLATFIASIVLMNALASITSLITHVKTPLWGIAYAILISLSLIRGGYRRFELMCKLLVAGMVLCFIISAARVNVPVKTLLRGLVPTLPGGFDSAFMATAILGGAVHITIIGMHTYNTNLRKWTTKDLGLARFDNILSMGVAFGIYSLSIFIVAAAMLYPNSVNVISATDAALSLGPLLGDKAMFLFLIGLWAATLSTISPTFLATAYFVSDLMKWEVNARDSKFAHVIVCSALLSALGPFIKVSFFLVLPGNEYPGT